MNSTPSPALPPQPAPMARLEVLALVEGGGHTVEAQAPRMDSPLVVHRTLDAWTWTITHRASGRAVALGFPTRENALAALRGLSQGNTDWAVQAEVLAASQAALEEVQAVASRWGGWPGK